MTGRENPFRNIKFVIRSSPRMLKIALITLILLSMAALGTLWWVRTGILADTEKLRQEAATLIDENAELGDKIGQVDSIEGILDIAESELDLVDPNTVIIEPTS